MTHSSALVCCCTRSMPQNRRRFASLCITTAALLYSASTHERYTKLIGLTNIILARLSPDIWSRILRSKISRHLQSRAFIRRQLGALLLDQGFRIKSSCGNTRPGADPSSWPPSFQPRQIDLGRLIIEITHSLRLAATSNYRSAVATSTPLRPKDCGTPAIHQSL